MGTETRDTTSQWELKSETRHLNGNWNQKHDILMGTEIRNTISQWELKSETRYLNGNWNQKHDVIMGTETRDTTSQWELKSETRYLNGNWNQKHDVIMGTETRDTTSQWELKPETRHLNGNWNQKHDISWELKPETRHLNWNWNTFINRSKYYPHQLNFANTTCNKALHLILVKGKVLTKHKVLKLLQYIKWTMTCTVLPLVNWRFLISERFSLFPLLLRWHALIYNTTALYAYDRACYMVCLLALCHKPALSCP